MCIVCAVHAVCDPPLYVAGLDSDNDDDTQSESSHTYNGKAFLVYTLKTPSQETCCVARYISSNCHREII